MTWSLVVSRADSMKSRLETSNFPKASQSSSTVWASASYCHTKPDLRNRQIRSRLRENYRLNNMLAYPAFHLCLEEGLACEIRVGPVLPSDLSVPTNKSYFSKTATGGAKYRECGGLNSR